MSGVQTQATRHLSCYSAEGRKVSLKHSEITRPIFTENYILDQSSPKLYLLRLTFLRFLLIIRLYCHPHNTMCKIKTLNTTLVNTLLFMISFQRLYSAFVWKNKTQETTKSQPVKAVLSTRKKTNVNQLQSSPNQTNMTNMYYWIFETWRYRKDPVLF